MRLRGDGAKRPDPLGGLFRPDAGPFLPGVDKGQAQDRPILAVFPKPGGDQLFAILLGGLPRLLDDREGTDERIELPFSDEREVAA